MYDLRWERWIPWRRRSGLVEWGAIPQLTDQDDADSVVGLAAPRPEFNGALTEFLIGLLTVAFQPEDEGDWKRLWDNPPDATEIAEKLRGLPDAFALGGDGLRFLQDHTAGDFEETGVLPIERLLFDAPGEQAIEQNKDLFVKRNESMVLGPPAGAMALIAMQTYAPAGGRGHRTSLRGGGPLTTLVGPRDPRASDRLWRLLWANVETVEQWEARRQGPREDSWPKVFPWLQKTRTSDPQQGGQPTRPAHGHPLQAYFGMPRRIRIEFGGPGICGLTGQASEITIVGWRTRNYGTDYDAWHHPLSPHILDKKSMEWRPVHAQPNGVGWKDWVSLAVDTADNATMPARTIAHFHSRGSSVGIREAQLHAFGVDFDNQKCRGWVEARLPFFVMPTEEHRLTLHDLARRLTEATDLAARTTRLHVKATLFQKPDEVRGTFDTVTRQIWEGTESTFYRMLGGAAASMEPAAVERHAREFHVVLRNSALAAFDHHCGLTDASPTVVRRVVAGRYRLSGFLAGRGGAGSTELARLLMLPNASKRAAAGAARQKGSRKA